MLGIVSGGRGDLAKCGGINNPVHYVRLRYQKLHYSLFILLLSSKKESIRLNISFYFCLGPLRIKDVKIYVYASIVSSTSFWLIN